MNFKKFVPWNWFKNEEESGGQVPVQQTGLEKSQRSLSGPLGQLHQEMDQLFDNFFEGFGWSPSRKEGLFPSSLTDGLLKPTVDIGASEKEYEISIEVPGVEQDDIKLEILNNTLTLCGEKKQEIEEKEKEYYRMERSYGSFQRVLAIPEDADEDEINAVFKNGVLKITMPRKQLQHSRTKRIEIK